MCAGFQAHHPGATWYTVPLPTATEPTSQVSAIHGLQHDYKHQKLLATPGPSTRRLISRAGSYFRAQHVVVSHLGLHTRNSVPKDVPMKQPAMYSYTAFHRYLYQIKFNTRPLLTEDIHISVHLPDDRPYTTLSIACIAG